MTTREMNDRLEVLCNLKGKEAHTKEVKLELKELLCREMINSILCSDFANILNNPELKNELFGLQGASLILNPKSKAYKYLSYYYNVLTENRVLGLIIEQANDIDKIMINTMKDSEGHTCYTYHTIVWKDKTKNTLYSSSYSSIK